MSIDDLRKDYSRASLTEADVDPDPVRQFSVWFRQALDGQTAPEIVAKPWPLVRLTPWCTKKAGSSTRSRICVCRADRGASAIAGMCAVTVSKVAQAQMTTRSR